MKEVDIEDEFDEKWAEMSEQEKDRIKIIGNFTNDLKSYARKHELDYYKELREMTQWLFECAMDIEEEIKEKNNDL